MSVVVAVLLIAMGALLFTAALVATRSEHPPHWMKDTLVANVLGPVVILMLALGAGMLIRGFANLDTLTFGALEGALTVAVLAAAYGAWRLMRVRDTLAAYKARTAAGEGITRAGAAGAAADVISIEPPPPEPSGSGKRAA